MVFIIITRVNHHHSYNTCVYHNNDKCNDHFLKHLVCEVVHGSVVVEQVLGKIIRMDFQHLDHRFRSVYILITCVDYT